MRGRPRRPVLISHKLADDEGRMIGMEASDLFQLVWGCRFDCGFLNVEPCEMIIKPRNQRCQRRLGSTSNTPLRSVPDTDAVAKICSLLFPPLCFRRGPKPNVFIASLKKLYQTHEHISNHMNFKCHLKSSLKHPQ